MKVNQVKCIPRENKPDSVEIANPRESINTINTRWDKFDRHTAVDIDVPSHEQVITTENMTEACELMTLLEELNSLLHLPPINMDEAYDFTSLLFTPEHPSNQSIEIKAMHLTPRLHKYRSNQ